MFRFLKDNNDRKAYRGVKYDFNIDISDSDNIHDATSKMVKKLKIKNFPEYEQSESHEDLISLFFYKNWGIKLSIKIDGYDKLLEINPSDAIEYLDVISCAEIGAIRNRSTIDDDNEIWKGMQTITFTMEI